MLIGDDDTQMPRQSQSRSPVPYMTRVLAAPAALVLAPPTTHVLLTSDGSMPILKNAHSSCRPVQAQSYRNPACPASRRRDRPRRLRNEEGGRRIAGAS